MTSPLASRRIERQQRGMSLIVVLIMLIVIGITAASGMRSATSEQRATNNLRLESTAQQYAEAALRYCETQLQITNTATRVVTLRTIPTTTFQVTGWEDPLSWTAANGRASSTRTSVPANVISTAGITEVPGTLPQCVAETQTQGAGTATFEVTVLTARGFSPDYAADADGKTTSGSVVWLQSIINGVF